MRKVEVPVYKFDELSAEVQEALINGSAGMGIHDSVEDYIETKLAQKGLKNLLVDDFSIGDEDQQDYITVSGALSDCLSQWENDEEFSELIPSISYCLLDEEDVNEDTNPFGISVGGNDMSEEEKEEARLFIEEKITEICDEIIADVNEIMEREDDDTFEVDADKVKEYLNGFEYLADGTAFDEAEYVK